MKLKRLMVLLLCTIMIFSSLTANAAFFIHPISPDNGEELSEFYDLLLDYLIENYKYDITKEELMTAAIKELIKEKPELYTELAKGAFTALDPNSSFYTIEEYTDVHTDVSGIYVGVGVHVYQDGTKVVLGEPIEGSPAVNSGLMVGDVVTAVDGVDVTGFALEKVTSMIKGKEGTEVSITVLRNGVYYTYTLMRAEIKINPVTYEILDGNIGYVKIASFNANTIEKFAETMKYMGDNGVETIILDLRNNLGGYLQAAVSVASYFIPNGELVVTEEFKNPEENNEFYAEETDKKFKAVVLVNEYSASASEVVSSALRDYGTGVLVGKRTFGKGTVQTTQLIRSMHYLWMTVAEYYTPSHTPIHETGLKPDYIVANGTADFDMSTVSAYDIERVLTVGCTGEDVYAVKERLKALGYSLTVDDIYDDKTAAVVENFQNATKLFPYGVADITTQIKLNDVLRDSKVSVDNQMEKAIEIAKNMK